MSGRYKYPFAQDEAERCHKEWGANCGPNALAFALQRPLESVRGAIPGFETKRYTSPSMMSAALEALGVKWDAQRPPIKVAMFSWKISLVRVQFGGPWTARGTNPRWAYVHTHWVACWLHETVGPCVFDVNGGMMSSARWQSDVLPLLTPPRGDREWWPTHIWTIG